MRSATIAIFGDPIPTAMLDLAQAVDRAIIETEQATNGVRKVQKQLKELAGKLSHETTRRLDAEYLHSRNCGGHSYPYLGDGTSDCEYCQCWMGPCRSGGPEGLDPFGNCPGNPKLRDAYKRLSEPRLNPADEEGTDE